MYAIDSFLDIEGAFDNTSMEAIKEAKIRHECLIQVQTDVHCILYFLDVSSTCFGCYLHPSSGTQLQRTAMGCVSVENV
jgi:hypothetical protein